MCGREKRRGVLHMCYTAVGLFKLINLARPPPFCFSFALDGLDRDRVAFVGFFLVSGGMDGWEGLHGFGLLCGMAWRGVVARHSVKYRQRGQ